MPLSGLTTSRLLRSSLLGGPQAAPGFVPASMVLNATTDLMAIQWPATGSPNGTIFTVSMWIKRTGTWSNTVIFRGTTAAGGASLPSFYNNSGTLGFFHAALGFDKFQSTGSLPALNTWEHWVVRYDSTQGTASNRVRMYRNGSAVTLAAGGDPGLNANATLFTNSRFFEIGSTLASWLTEEMKLAFIDVAHGESHDHTSFTFDDGGTLTRMPFTGNYGLRGFSLDGSTGVAGEDVSGGGWDLTATSVTLDTADLPPWTN